MTINASGQVTFGGTTPGESVQYEVFKSGTEQISFNDSVIRRLSGQSAGAVDVNTMHSKTFQWTDTAQISCQGLGGSGTLWDGISVDISEDGTTLAIGASYDSLDAPHGEHIGCVFIFTRSGDNWTFQTRIRPTGYTLYSYYDSLYGMTFYYGPEAGTSVALSSDGNYLAIGGPQDNSSGTHNGIGRVWIFTRSGSTWTQQTSFYPPDYTTSGAGYVDFGTNLVMNSDATTVVVGGPYDNTNTGGNGPIGAAWVYTRSGTTWTKQAKLVPSGYVQGYAGNDFGTGMSISSDGNTVAIGGRAERNGTAGASGACYIFTRSGTTWTQQVRLSPTLVPSLPNSSYFGKSSALSPDGNTLVVSAPQNYTYHWGPSVFTRSGSTWTYRTTLTSPKAWSGDYQGMGVTLSPNPRDSSVYDLIFTTGQDANSAVAIYTGSGASWSELSYIKPTHPSIPSNITVRFGDDTTTDYAPIASAANSRLFVVCNRYGTQTYNGVSYGGTYVFSK